MDERLERLREQAAQAPQKPGVYLMRDARGEVIYVGKAVNLRNRLRSYFQPSAAQHSIKVRRLLAHLASLEWIVVGSELEALILEMNLIKRYRPRYNIQLKDDKRYPYIKIHWADPFPKVTVTRRVMQDGARYYGPYTSVWAVHQTLNALRKVFPYLTCNRPITGRDARACLYYDLGLCLGPCIGAVTQAEYRAMIEELARFLEGQTEPVVQRLERAMREAAERLEFEKAARLRDQLRAIQHIVERQRIISPKFGNSDVLAIARDRDEAVVQVFFIRNGKMLGRKYFVFENTEGATDAEVLAQFLKTFYGQEGVANRPERVLLPQDLEEARIIEQWLRQKGRGERIHFVLPRDEDEAALVELAAQNAAETLAALRAQWEAEHRRQTEALAALQSVLNLDRPPHRIEGYDVSTLHGVATTVSMVVFEQALPRKGHYRRFNIRGVTGVDDYAALEEALDRRFARWQAAQALKQEPGAKPDESFARLPDLILIDGGPGQLNRARAVLARYGLTARVTILALAKQEEAIYLPDRSEPLHLEPHDPALHLLQRVRDEAHRFALTSHRRRRRRDALRSALEDIPGVGPRRRQALLQHFGTLDALMQATPEALAQVPGIPRRLAQQIWAYLHGGAPADAGATPSTKEPNP
ncbi:MAG: excinuclease ABC subunit UvrC [Chloroflexi bacterium]|nr:excinuclease ABC subunit UvrC [Chloroflexota bacterium]